MLGGNDVLKLAISRETRIPIWLTHLWQRRAEHERFGLVLGAGVSKDAGCPMWSELLKRLTTAVKVSKQRMALHKKGGHRDTFIAEIIFRKHSEKEMKENLNLSDLHAKLQVNSSWRELIHKCLYRKMSNKSFLEIVKNHRYINELAELICNSRFAVTFNFDDIVDEAVIEFAKNQNIPNPEIIVRPKVETRKNAPVIYHINGILPREQLRRSSENIILTEDAFADILIAPNSQEAEFVVNQFSVRTFLLLGVSLSDNSLKNLLRSSAKRNPANHHFIVYHEIENEPRSDEERSDIFDVNLNVYNLISIFLTTPEIEGFLKILNTKDSVEFDNSLRKLVPKMIDRKYHLVGSVAAGKSSILEALRCFTTFEEWSGRVPAEMYLNDKSLTQEQQKKVDDFLFPQLIQKNNNMIRNHSGLRVMDRAYLDLFAFSKSRLEIERKAKELKRQCLSWGKPLETGHIFFLTASDGALEERLARRGVKKGRRGKTRFDVEGLVRQEDELKKIYRPADCSIFDTSELSVGVSARRIAREILLGSYSSFDFVARLDEIISEEGAL